MKQELDKIFFVGVLVVFLIAVTCLAVYIAKKDAEVVSQYSVQAEHIKMSNQYNYCPYCGESLREKQ